LKIQDSHTQSVAVSTALIQHNSGLSIQGRKNEALIRNVLDNQVSTHPVTGIHHVELGADELTVLDTTKRVFDDRRDVAQISHNLEIASNYFIENLNWDGRAIFGTGAAPL